MKEKKSDQQLPPPSPKIAAQQPPSVSDPFPLSPPLSPTQQPEISWMNPVQSCEQIIQIRQELTTLVKRTTDDIDGWKQSLPKRIQREYKELYVIWCILTDSPSTCRRHHLYHHYNFTGPEKSKFLTPCLTFFNHSLTKLKHTLHKKKLCPHKNPDIFQLRVVELSILIKCFGCCYFLGFIIDAMNCMKELHSLLIYPPNHVPSRSNSQSQFDLQFQRSSLSGDIPEFTLTPSDNSNGSSTSSGSRSSIGSKFGMTSMYSSGNTSCDSIIDVEEPLAEMQHDMEMLLQGISDVLAPTMEVYSWSQLINKTGRGLHRTVSKDFKSLPFDDIELMKQLIITTLNNANSTTTKKVDDDHFRFHPIKDFYGNTRAFVGVQWDDGIRIGLHNQHHGQYHLGSGSGSNACSPRMTPSNSNGNSNKFGPPLRPQSTGQPRRTFRVVITFTGTDQIQVWQTNAHAATKQITLPDGTNVLVHRGIQNMMEDLWIKIDHFLSYCYSVANASNSLLAVAAAKAVAHINDKFAGEGSMKTHTSIGGTCAAALVPGSTSPIGGTSSISSMKMGAKSLLVGMAPLEISISSETNTVVSVDDGDDDFEFGLDRLPSIVSKPYSSSARYQSEPDTFFKKAQSEFSLLGHSLGGGLAMLYGLKASTFFSATNVHSVSCSLLSAPPVIKSTTMMPATMSVRNYYHERDPIIQVPYYLGMKYLVGTIREAYDEKEYESVSTNMDAHTAYDWLHALANNCGSTYSKANHGRSTNSMLNHANLKGENLFRKSFIEGTSYFFYPNPYKKVLHNLPSFLKQSFVNLLFPSRQSSREDAIVEEGDEEGDHEEENSNGSHSPTPSGEMTASGLTGERMRTSLVYKSTYEHELRRLTSSDTIGDESLEIQDIDDVL